MNKREFALILIIVLVVATLSSCAKQDEPQTPAGYKHIIIVQLADNTMHKFRADYTKETNGFMYIYENGRSLEIAAIPQTMIKMVTHEEEQQY